MNEEQQGRAALYALGLLDADEAAAFEHETAADGELRVLADELREAAAALARTTGGVTPSPALKTGLLEEIAEEARPAQPTASKIIAGPSAWAHRIPWTLAAALALFCGILGWKYLALDLEIQMSRYAASFPRMNALQQVSYCPLEPVPAAQQTGPQAAVLWDAAHRRGKLHITKLPAPGDGKDYQLWTVEAGVKDPVNSGVVKVGEGDVADVEFQPENDDGKTPVVAFALSRERAGGVPKSEGTILFLGKLSP